MRIKIAMIVLAIITTSTLAAQAQLCEGFTTDPNDFIAVPAVELLPQQGYGATQPFVRGGVEYTGASLLIGTECPGSWGVLSLCDFSSPATGIPAAGTSLTRYALDFWADVWINPFRLEIELQSGAIEVFTATTSGGFVGYCAPIGETIVRLEMVGHDGTATAIYHADDSPVATDAMTFGVLKALYR